MYLIMSNTLQAIKSHLKSLRIGIGTQSKCTKHTILASTGLNYPQFNSSLIRFYGFLFQTYFAHCVYVSEEEIDVLLSNGTGVSHCPASNFE